MTKFLRRIWSRYSKLGKRRKKKQKWRNPTGRDNKMREKRKGRPAVVSIGYRKSKKERLGNKNNTVFISNVKGLEKVKKGQKVMIKDIGNRKREEVAKAAKEKKIEIQNLNVKKFLRKQERKKKNESKK